MSITRRILDGFKILFPLLIFVILVGWLAGHVERMFRPLVTLVVPVDAYFPGLGLLIGLVSLAFLSLAVQAWAMRAIYAWFIRQLKKIPVFKTVYTWINNLVGMVGSPDAKRSGKPVIVDMSYCKVLGFITDEHMQRQLEMDSQEGKLAVYLPMSYQIGGYTVLVDRKQVEELEMSADKLFSIIISAGLLDKKEHDG